MISKLFSLAGAGPASSSSVSKFAYNGFLGANLELNGAAEILPNGLLRLTNNNDKQEVGHAFHPIPFSFLNSFEEPFSFSTSFIFAIFPLYADLSSEGIAFAVSPTSNLPAVLPSQYLGLYNYTHNDDPNNHIVAVELDTTESKEFSDINDNHVGIDVNGLKSVAAAPASFFSDSSFDFGFQNLSLISGEPMQIWAEYDSKNIQFNVTIAPLNVKKPSLPLLSSKVNLSSVLLRDMYVGFSASTGAATGSHCILGWSFAMNETAEELNHSKLPVLPPREEEAAMKKTNHWVLPISIAVAVSLLLSICTVTVVVLLKKRRKYAEVIEEWEKEYGPQRLSYRVLYKATRGFSKENILGNGGFGEVYKGQLPKSKQQIAVKKISHESKQGMKEFVAEIASIGQLRHRNLVQLLGYSRQQGKLMLVYEFMPNGSLDKYIFGRVEKPLSWKQRFHIIKGIAAALLYLHEEWEQVVLHRDIKACNVLLDAKFNGKLGDFGLARLQDRGEIAETTRVMGTFGYLAPELSRTGKSTTSSDVFAFGAFLLEVACGKRPVELRGCGVQMVLVDWVIEFLKKGKLLEACDRRLEEFESEEVEMVLRLGLMCSHPMAAARPGMRQVVQYLERETPLPEMTAEDFSLFQLASLRNGLVDCAFSVDSR
ncbi:L-type lectin-domain containing receptor kinase IV.1-like [Phalaenopsis equestris]|uniref:L-type lectin-domain containing receptor kinase IV.1-like n=1 Tax=Phalaenopsis equestris TaxID=78828 RepID=UPI0009E6434C|nr:L-type lectin-domain containing receptor kinase IV.1-like [Phalaenopsis equestris]